MREIISTKYEKLLKCFKFIEIFCFWETSNKIFDGKMKISINCKKLTMKTKSSEKMYFCEVILFWENM